MTSATETRTAAALVIGNELLTGKIADANTVVLARTLRRCGVKLCRVVTVLDDTAAIIDEVKTLSEHHDVVFTSGGVGPTHDDVTIESVARAFGVEIVVNEAIESMIRAHYGDRLTAGHLRGARVPEGARLVVSLAMPWPTIVMRNVWVLPGIPEIFAMKMPVVMEELGGVGVVSVGLYLSLDEGPLKPYLDAVVEAFPGVEVGSYPKWRDPHYKTKITFDAIDEVQAMAARDALARSLPEGSVVPEPPATVTAPEG